MPGFNQQQIQAKVRTGNEIVILIGDQVIGFGQSSSFGVDFGAEVFYAIGSANPQEIQQLKNGITFSVDAFQLTQEGLASLGYPSDILDVLSGNQFNISALDANGNVIHTAVGCVAHNCNVSMPANAVVTESVSFSGMDVLGPDGSSILNANNALTTATIGATALQNLVTP